MQRACWLGIAIVLAGCAQTPAEVAREPVEFETRLCGDLDTLATCIRDGFEEDNARRTGVIRVQGEGRRIIFRTTGGDGVIVSMVELMPAGAEVVATLRTSTTVWYTAGGMQSMRERIEGCSRR